jgi:hypothetical protein
MCVNFNNVVMVYETFFCDFSECFFNIKKVVLISVELSWS